MVRTFFAREAGQAVLDYTILVLVVGFVAANILSFVGQRVLLLYTQIVAALG